MLILTAFEITKFNVARRHYFLGDLCFYEPIQIVYIKLQQSCAKAFAIACCSVVELKQILAILPHRNRSVGRNHPKNIIKFHCFVTFERKTTFINTCGSA